jgi:hypothetical protein
MSLKRTHIILADKVHMYVVSPQRRFYQQEVQAQRQIVTALASRYTQAKEKHIYFQAKH